METLICLRRGRTFYARRAKNVYSNPRVRNGKCSLFNLNGTDHRKNFDTSAPDLRSENSNLFIVTYPQLLRLAGIS